MSYSSFRKVNLAITIIFVILLTFWVYTTEAADMNVTAGWGDVVDVHYYRYTNPDYTGIAEDNNIEYIYLSGESSVPADLLALFPDASASYFSDFKSGIIGLSEGDTNRFTALESGTYYYFDVTLLTIRYDAVVEGSTTSGDTTTTTAYDDPLGGLGNLILFGGGGTIITGGLLSWVIISSRRRSQILSSETNNTSRREEEIKQSKTKLKELRELTESRETELIEKQPKDSSNIKFRRRR